MKKILLLALSCIVGGIIIGLSFNASAQESSSIPSWIKNNARFWATDQIGDSDFISGLQYLATNKIIHLTQPLTTNNTSSTSLPLWIKGLAGSWADGKISNDYFASTLQFMVNQNIIKL